MPIDPNIAIGAELPTLEFAWTASDVQHYHLALGAGSRPLDEKELRYLTDRTPQVLPTFATVAANFHAVDAPQVSFPGVDIDLAKVVHGSQEVTVHRPLPPEGKARTTTRIAEVWDKGKAAVIVQESATTDVDGVPLWTSRSSIFARGEGGFGGERGPSQSVGLPDRPSDADVDIPVLPQQALMYRMCGDRNPLHSDPQFAAAAGFPAPILHGLCTYGMVCKAVVDTMLDSDASLVAGFRARFAGVVFPGETLHARIWKEAGLLLISATVPERDHAHALADVVLTITER
ncbi:MULTISPECIES: MaoC/PaaZ C-terminal domain-containing protein [Rhodococcus]|uniref:MaoC/PaaZ C-terminal domain-containing protein n=1 Tax=Rhodococcus oxybenzonivorans TaxID=1990687 RepID=A0AAE5A6A7_9NOCA|nr:MULTISPECIES: MaoC/PaaZ C-terminal domain-containing protein [Rhodococcus]MDV7241237.1 MaoC/PaaZ C-terminal domain-containing protein [Rhodococcus oxybenzonivorans]MDV7265715.1 MaoC/PaaZ C-terminal domain-containing protein [Rhodococcus oxybenzonivorans]MDV7273510.1 MaoC/PaaZ C-terminal domain-containing protein [Rhodococcus oxybenzonivorans]MDV7332752.1 MaoC/PaaZ C-terminal domain-containing protein [Rhodococcus oxybenzonivorans]MDV7341918.1 MaoC/PaaZ C-terminal domain-containing protein [